MKADKGIAVAAIGVAWALSACVGQLQFDPLQSSGAGGSGLPIGGQGGQVAGGQGGAVAAGSGGATGGTPSPNDAGVQDALAQASCPAGFDVLTSIFKTKCGGCHGATAPTKNLDLVTAGIAARTVDKLSTCNNKPLISSTLIAGAPTGHLLDKLAGPVTGCGVQMPAGGTPLSSTEMACVNQWALGAIQTVLDSRYP